MALLLDHADRFPAPDRKHFEVTLQRRHLLNTDKGLEGENVQEYAVSKTAILSLGRCMDVLMVVSEVPPDVAPVVEGVQSTLGNGDGANWWLTTMSFSCRLCRGADGDSSAWR